MAKKHPWETKRRYAQGNRGTPDNCLYVKSAPLVDLYVINHIVNGTEHPIVMNLNEAERLHGYLGEHVGKGKDAAEAGMVDPSPPKSLWGDLPDNLLTEAEWTFLMHQTGMSDRDIAKVLLAMTNLDFDWTRGGHE